MSVEFDLLRKRGETAIPPTQNLAVTTRGTTTAISPVDIGLGMPYSTFPVDPQKIYGIGGSPSLIGYHIVKDLRDDFNVFGHQITAKLETIFDRLSDLEKTIEGFSTITKVLVIEEISKDEAKKRISECLCEIEEKIYPSEVAERLHIDYDLCVEIIEELLKEGEIEIVEE